MNIFLCRKKSFRRSRKVYFPQDPLPEERKVRIVVKWLHNHVMKSVFFLHSEFMKTLLLMEATLAAENEVGLFT